MTLRTTVLRVYRPAPMRIIRRLAAVTVEFGDNLTRVFLALSIIFMYLDVWSTTIVLTDPAWEEMNPWGIFLINHYGIIGLWIWQGFMITNYLAVGVLTEPWVGPLFRQGGLWTLKVAANVFSVFRLLRVPLLFSLIYDLSDKHILLPQIVASGQMVLSFLIRLVARI